MEVDPDEGNEDIPQHDAEFEIDPPLYDGSPITVSESVLSILALTTRFNVSRVLLSAIIELIAMHCPAPNKCISSLYYFKKYFKNIQNPLQTYFYCSRCFEFLQNEDDDCETCMQLTEKKYFIIFSIISQLQALFNRQGFRQKLRHKFTREKQAHTNFEDIYDGFVYQELSQEGAILSNPDNISFTWYTDGIPIFKSSKFSVWPFYLIVNELPYSERFKKENVILAGLWFGEDKPVPNLFLLPHHNEIQQLLNGIPFDVPDIPDQILVKAVIISGTCDLPAKALFLNMNQYNGKFGCHKFKTPGQRIENVQVYPYTRNLRLRTDRETLAHAQAAEQYDRPVCGVKGSTIISRLMYTSWIRTTAVDPMHCVFVGLQKALLKLWFDAMYANERFSAYNQVAVVDRRLTELQPPEFVQRRPRTIKDHLAYWKASELKNFFFYFSLPILEDVLPREYLEHFKLLVSGIYLLCQPSLTMLNIENASRALNEFVSRFEHLYGLRHMSSNLHSLLHFPQSVCDLGPLWVYSCFPFEDLNGKIKNLVHGSKCAQLQISHAASLFLNTYTLNKEVLVEGRKAYEFCKKLHSATKKMKLQEIGPSSFICGKTTNLEIPVDVEEVLEMNGIAARRKTTFKKLLKNGLVYSSEIYTRTTKTNSTCAAYMNYNGIMNIGIIRFFLRLTDCNCLHVCPCPAQHYAVVRKCDAANFSTSLIPGLTLPFIHRLTIRQHAVDLVEVNQLRTICFVVQIPERNIICAVQPVNTIEAE